MFRRREEFERRIRLEGLEGRLLLASDFGDAPAPYFTTLAENGARHEAVGPQLGATRDMEVDGVHSPAADGDRADDDGVTFGTIRVGQLDAVVTVSVQNAPSGARVDAWIDFNADGSWGGPDEQIANNVAVVNGDNALTFDVPSWAVEGTTIARFRLSTTGNLGVRGAAADGEVEDYQVPLTRPAFASGAFGGQNVVAAGIAPRSIAAVDLNGDGDMDVLSANSNDHRLRWHENSGSEKFTARAISEYDEGAHSVFSADLDGDGDTDAITASYAQNQVIWYENDGNESFTRRVIGNTAGAEGVLAADMDGDGDLDILSGFRYDDRIAWFENNGSQLFLKRIISNVIERTAVVMAADIDGDGDMDAIAVTNGVTIAWYENNGNQVFMRRVVDLAVDRAATAVPTDLDRDGDLDLVVPMAYQIVWYENNGTESFLRRVIVSSNESSRFRDAQSVDLDGDGDLDVVGPESSGPFERIMWYENGGAQIFTPRIISTAVVFPLATSVADVDGDGDLDVLSASLLDGKIAWYENLNLEFGDAPAPYPTTLAENGARHEFGGPQLGATVGQERDGVHSAAVAGEHADDDGVRYCSIRVGQLDAAVNVNVQNAPAGARLDAWIDFDGDGSWGGALEQIANNLYLTSGDHTVNFDVPSWAAEGETFARFRISTDGNLGVRGMAPDGEVEDYAVMIAPPALTDRVFGDESMISAAVDGPLGVHAADMDRDGDMDIVSASFYDSTIAWHENDGNQNFSSRVVSSSHFGANSVLAVDMNVDGDMDVIAASYYDDRIVLYENNGAQMFTSRPIGTADGVWGLFVADIDTDGDTDVLSASRDDSTIAWFSNSGSQTFSKRIVHAQLANGAYSVFAADVDGDGDMDVLSASLNDGKISWYENDGNQSFAARTVSNAAVSAQSVFATDVDGDGDTDVLSASRGDDKIAWYENDGNQNFTMRVISTTADLARSVFAADLDGDGDTDVLSASSGDDEVTWYENDGSQNFTTRAIYDGTTPDGASRVFAADIDTDGDLDVLSASNRGDRISWFENGRSPGPVGDLNGDSRVDRADAAVLAQNFGSLGASASQGDLNGDGRVGLRDLAILQSNLDVVAPSPTVAAAPIVGTATQRPAEHVAQLAASRRRAGGGARRQQIAAVDKVMNSGDALAAGQSAGRILRARRHSIAAPVSEATSGALPL
jgi:hypothetical protein